MSPHNLRAIGNLPRGPVPLRGGGKKTGFIVIRRVGVDTIEDVVGATLVRIANNKPPYGVILENASQVAELREAAARFAEQHGDLMKAGETGGAPRETKAKRYDAGPAEIARSLAPALRQLDDLLIDNEATDTAASLDPHTTKVYLSAHGMVGGKGIFRKTADGTPVRTSSNALAKFFRDRLRLRLDYEDLRLQVCRGATQPRKEGEIPTAQHVANAMANAGFHALTVSGYAGSIRSFPQMFDGALHNSIVPDLKTKPVRRGGIRQAFRATVEARGADPVATLEACASDPVHDALRGDHARVAPGSPSADRTPSLAEIARQSREMGSWNNIGGELAPRLLTELPAWPEGRALELLGRNATGAASDLVELVVLGREGVGRARVSVLLDGAHYTAIVGDRLVPVPADGDCFFHAVLEALGDDASEVAKRLGLAAGTPVHDVVRALRSALGDFIEANPQRVEALLANEQLLADRADSGSTEVQDVRVPDHLSREARTLDTLRGLAQSLLAATSAADVQAAAGGLLARDLVAGMVEMQDGLQVRAYQASGDPSQRAALKRQNALRKSIDVGYLQLLHALVRAGDLNAGEVWEALLATEKGSKLASYVLSSASEASIDVGHAHALVTLLREVAQRITGGSVEVRTRLLQAASPAGLHAGDKYRDFYGRLFGNGSSEVQTSASVVAGKRLADADLVPSRREIEATISPARATKYLKAAQRAQKEHRRLADDLRAEPPHAALEAIAKKLLRQLDPARLQGAVAAEARAFANHEQKERRIAANGRIAAVVRAMVQEQWTRVMAEARDTLQPALFAWVLAPEHASSRADAARSLPDQVPEQLFRTIYDEVVAKPEMQSYIEQLVAGGEPGERDAQASVSREVGDVVASEGQLLVDRVRSKAETEADRAAKERADRDAAGAARDAAHDAAWGARRAAEEQARRDADRVAADAAREAAEAVRERAESVARDSARRDVEAQAARALEDEARRAFDRQMERLERVHPGNVANMRDAEDAMLLDAAPAVPRTRVGVRVRAAEYLDAQGRPRIRWR